MEKDFFCAIYEMTEAQWTAITARNFSNTSKTGKRVISWNDIRGNAGSAATPTTGLIATINAGTKLSGFDLGTESMWEVAARAGEKTANQPAPLGDYVWYKDNSGSTYHNVGEKKPNIWGIYDMLGNSWEHTRDTANESNLATIQVDGQKPTTTGAAANAVVRGSDTYSSASNSQLTYSGRHFWPKSNTGGGVCCRLFYIAK